MLRDLLERVVYTALATALAAIPATQALDLSAWYAAAGVAAVTASTALVAYGRERLGILPATPGTIRDAVERVLWTFVVAAIPAVPAAAVFDLSAWEAAASVGFVAAADVVLILVRLVIPALPSPGKGLPGLPTPPRAEIAARSGP